MLSGVGPAEHLKSKVTLDINANILTILDFVYICAGNGLLCLCCDSRVYNSFSS